MLMLDLVNKGNMYELNEWAEANTTHGNRELYEAVHPEPPEEQAEHLPSHLDSFVKLPILVLYYSENINNI